MKQLITKATAMLSLLAIAACSEDSLVENTPINDGTIKEISITGEDFQFDGETRSSVTISESGASFTWDEDDVIGIFPNIGDQVSFAMSEGAGTQTAVFSGGGWALKSSATYAAYYPHVYENRDLTKIPVSYVGQTQNGNNNTDHIGAYDFMAASVSTPSNGKVAFDMQHLGCLVQLTITIPKPAALSKVTLITNGQFTQTGTIDLTVGGTPIIPNTTSGTFEVALQGIQTTTEDEDVTIYFMLPSTDLSTNTLKVKVITSLEENVEYNLLNRNFEAGKAYALIGSDIPTYYVGTAGTLSSMISDEEKFAIAKIKVSGNLNGDDIRFIREMAGSDHLGNSTDGILQSLDISNANFVEGGKYYYNYTSSSDKEYYYYTEANLIGTRMFTECTSLVSVKLPYGITTIGACAFEDCTNLVNVTMPNSTLTIGSSAFNSCEKITNITIPNRVAEIGSKAFYGCHGLTNVLIPSSVTSITADAFDYCNGLEQIVVDESNQIYCAIDGILYNKDVTSMLICPYAYVANNLTIPSTVTSLASFKNRLGVSGKITIPGSVSSIIGEGFMNCSGITEIVMEEGVKSIGYNAFRGTKIEKATMPSTISSIADGAFYACTSLSEVYYYGTPVNLYTDVFYNIASGCKLYVAQGKKESFVNSTSWSRFFNESDIIEISD